jgi:hypothetical protein
MNDLATRSEPQLMLDLMMASLRVRDERLNAIVGELLIRHGGRPVPQLIRVAANPKNGTGHRVRALEALARIGPPYGLELTDLLVLLQRTRNKAVRAAAAKLFGSAGSEESG